MGDLAALADSNSVNAQGDKEVSKSNYIKNGEEHHYGEPWDLTRPSDGGYITKNHSGDDSNLDTPDRGQKNVIKKSSIFKEFLEATSPILSPLLSQVKNKQSSDTILFSEATVKQLASETNCDNKGINSPEKSTKDKTSTNVKHKTSPGELNKRRKIKTEDERKTPKQIKEESNRSVKGACPQCGMTNTEGLRTICKSCMNLRKENKSKETPNLKKRRNKAVSGADAQTKSETPPSAEIEQNDEEIYTEGDSPNKSRSMSLDLKGIADTLVFPDKKYCPPKRTSTDLGQSSKNDIYTGSPTPKQSPDKLNSRLTGSNQGLNDIGFATGDLTFGSKHEDKQSSQQVKVDAKHRLMKRSTTDSEIVSKVKMNASIGKDNDRKSSADSKAVNGNKKFDSAKTLSGKREHSGSSVKSESPDVNKEHNNISYKLERSKTILGKVNFESERKPDGAEGIKTKELSSNSLDNDRNDTKSKKLFNSVRSHTIIGDGLAKRQKQKSESAKTKSGKREGSSNSVKKKQDSKHSGDAEDEKRVSFVEEDCLKRKGHEEEPKQINNTIPKTLYDCCHEDDSSDSDDESEAESIEDVAIAESNLQPTPLEPTIIKLTSNQDEKQINNLTKPKPPIQDNMRWLKMASDYGNSFNEQLPRYDNYDNDRGRDAQNQIENSSTFKSYAMDVDDDDDDAEQNKSNFNVDNIKVTYTSSNEQIYNTLERIDEENEESEYEDTDYRPSSENWYTEVANITSVCNSDLKVRDIVKKENFERSNSFGQEAKHEENELSYTDYHPYTISRSVKEIDDLDEYTSWDGKEKMLENRESSYCGMIAQRSSLGRESDEGYFGYETDVDTGLAVTLQNPVDSYKTIATRNEWGFLNASDDSSSSSDDSDNEEDDDAWYTGGIYTKKSKSSTSEKNDDLIYYNDNAGAQMSDSDIYTGELFSNLDSKVNEIKDMSRNNNISLEENILARRKIWYNISSRPQMHPATTETVVNTGVIAHTEDGILLPFYNLSNNGNYDDEEEYLPPQETRADARNIKQMVLTRSDYTEYANVVNQVKPKKDLILFGNTDFAKYDMPKYEGKAREEEGFLRKGDSDKVELVFFGENQKQINKPYIPRGCEQNLYFNTSIPENVNYEHNYDREQERKLDRDDSYQGGFFYASRYGCNNNNGNDTDGPSESYTGCFRNEEEYKPTFEGLFNDKPTSFNFQKRRPDVDHMYFASSNSKSYYDIEDSIYAFEQKERVVKKKPEKPPIVKVGGITVRNNVEHEVDYAQNINMDLQMTSWKRYDAVGDEAPETEGSNYAKNILFEEMVGGKPWVMDECRAPWKVVKPQCNIPGKSKTDTKWKAPDNLIIPQRW